MTSSAARRAKHTCTIFFAKFWTNLFFLFLNSSFLNSITSKLENTWWNTITLHLLDHNRILKSTENTLNRRKPKRLKWTEEKNENRAQLKSHSICSIYFGCIGAHSFRSSFLFPFGCDSSGCDEICGLTMTMKMHSVSFSGIRLHIAFYAPKNFTSRSHWLLCLDYRQLVTCGREKERGNELIIRRNSSQSLFWTKSGSFANVPCVTKTTRLKPPNKLVTSSKIHHNIMCRATRYGKNDVKQRKHRIRYANGNSGA